MKQLLFFILVLSLTTQVLAHSGENTSETNTDNEDKGLTLLEIYAITLTVGILLALILYQINIIRDRKFLYEMIGLAILLLTIDFFIMKSKL